MASDEQGVWTSLLLLERFQCGDDHAATEIFDRYFRRLTALAHNRLSARLAARTDPEDVVLSAYRSFFIEARGGRYTLSQGGDLWRLLAAMTKHKLLRQVRRAHAGRRSVTVELRMDAIDEARLRQRNAEPTPEEAAALADELERILSRLDPFGRRVLELRLQGLPIDEIALDTGRSERSVRRRMASIRSLMAGPDEGKPVRAESAPPDPITGPARRAEGRPDPVEFPAGLPVQSHEQFLLRRLVGAGRMGKVYEALDREEDVAVAVKFLRKTLLDRPEVVRRFLGEARTVAALDHPNIVAMRGLGRTPAGSYFLLMDLVNGTDLARLSAERSITAAEAVAWLMDACAALEHAHKRGVVHCDLKPANLILDVSGRIRLTDFGPARSLAGETPGAALVEGTAPFMAPEQASACWGPITRRTDVYGLGAVLFALMTGRPPFAGRRLPDVLAQVVSARPADSPASLRPDLPEALCALCLRCLAKDPQQRFPTMAALRSTLDSL